MNKPHIGAKNYSINWYWDNQKRPRSLAVRLFPAFWRKDRKAKRIKLMTEINGWLDELKGNTP